MAKSSHAHVKNRGFLSGHNVFCVYLPGLLTPGDHTPHLERWYVRRPGRPQLDDPTVGVRMTHIKPQRSAMGREELEQLLWSGQCSMSYVELSMLSGWGADKLREVFDELCELYQGPEGEEGGKLYRVPLLRRAMSAGGKNGKAAQKRMREEALKAVKRKQFEKSF